MPIRFARLRRLIASYAAGAVVLGLLASVYLTGIGDVRFHVDESSWISASNALEAIESGDPRSGMWSESYFTLTLGPLTRYLIGLGRRAGGYGEEALNGAWAWEQGRVENEKSGNMPGPGLLWWSRLPMAILSVLGILIFWRLTADSAGMLAGSIVVLIFVVNPYFLTMLRRAMSEAPLFAFIAFAAFCANRAVASYPNAVRALAWSALAGTWSGAAGAAKLNGLGAVPAGALLCVLTPVASDASIPTARKGAFAAAAFLTFALCATSAFILPNPYLYEDVAARTHKLYEFRIQEMQRQMDNFPQQVVGSGWRRARILSSRILRDESVMNFAGGAIISAVFASIGIVVLTLSAACWMRGAGGSGASAVLLAFAVTTAIPSLATPLDWDRFYLLPVVFSSVFTAVGLARTAELLGRRMRSAT